MLSNEECKAYIKKYNLTEKQISQIKDNLYAILEVVIDEYLSNAKKEYEKDRGKSN